MAMIHSSDVLPRRLTQLFADNKKSYEALVQPRQTGPEVSHLNLKLRIQKDRLIAWGIQWSDRSTASQTGDIDQSLDKAGISDLVASIMGSIRELLDEAESLQPQPLGNGRRLAEPKAAAILASNSGISLDTPWSATSIERLEEILKDLTTSIDTLCDLSRSKVEGADPRPAAGNRLSIQKPPLYSSKQSSPSRSLIRHSQLMQEKRRSPDPSPGREGLSDLAFIDSGLLRLRSHRSSMSAPPSYESIAAGSEFRQVAAFSAREGGKSNMSQETDMPLLLDFRQPGTGRGRETSSPDKKRFEELLLGLLKFPAAKESVYTGIMKLNGWTTDTQRSRCAFIYEIPPSETGANIPIVDLQPRSLLSFLQNGGDSDSNNMPSLENRLKLAHNVALSILHLHEIDITHRNISSNNFVFFLDRKTTGNQLRIWKGPIIRKPYLTGFHQSDLQSGESEARFSGLYHHPALAGDGCPEYSYVHDYYSLGLVLLEIGLWMPIGKFWKSRYTMSDFKDRLQDIYLKKLAAKCSDGYMNAVLACMTAADMSQEGEERLSDEDAASMQLADFKLNVVEPLERCCRIDISGEPVMWSHDVDEELESRGHPSEQAVVESSAGSFTARERAVSRQSASTLLAASHNTMTRSIAKQPKIRVWTHELPALYSNYWTSTMFPKLNKILRKALSKWESYTIDLFMAGKDPDTARPTVYMECASTSKVQRILRHLNKDLRLFEIKVVSGQVVRSKAGKKKKRPGKNPAIDSSLHDLNPFYQEKPNCGASIGAYLNGSHLPPVTFGGAVLVGGEPFGMSVHHMLEDEEEIELGLEDRFDLQRSMAGRRENFSLETDDLSDIDENVRSDSFDAQSAAGSVETSSTFYDHSEFSQSGIALSSHTSHSMAKPQPLYPFEMDDDELDFSDNDDDPENDFWLSPSFDGTAELSDDDDDEDDFELGDTVGISPGYSSSLYVTQPALDDVKEGFFPTPEDAAAEHLSSHTLGYVHASSGLRRCQTEDLIHEIDWALIKFSSSRLPVCLSALATTQDSTHTVMSSGDLAARSVHSHTRTSGLFARGTILPSMRLIRMPGRSSPSHSWQVKGSFGSGGDSGAWVFDDETGAVCGHVLAYSERSEVAYISPMDVTLKDMERVLGKTVALPSRLPMKVQQPAVSLPIRSAVSSRPEAGPLPSKFRLVTVPATPTDPTRPQLKTTTSSDKQFSPGMRSIDSTNSWPVPTSPSPEPSPSMSRQPRELIGFGGGGVGNGNNIQKQSTRDQASTTKQPIKRKEVGRAPPGSASSPHPSMQAGNATKNSNKKGVNVC